MQKRSPSMPDEAKAQQEPQYSWSLIGPTQPGHLSLASKLRGRSLAPTII
jgi:hypothetical protein